MVSIVAVYDNVFPDFPAERVTWGTVQSTTEENPQTFVDTLFPAGSASSQAGNVASAIMATW